ncbi:E3 ubiquitin-protein ligase rnf168 [Scleropages formosus]|uniref:RING-type E3 ubiquitin transferase n=1 Tax=Scleropages formosus TaxID=113540 RepID=A0A8C9S6J8_SCLFO|nr:E3 ubiquitin-protein ligase RNF168 [Scleropages formosus]XP_018604161.2 E3 ubiquitin-protein ligase RNF168 [Scleropages formosus]
MPPVAESEAKAKLALAQGGAGETGTLSWTDCLCPVCLEIFLEPVTLPCGHTFCKACFLETVDKASLTCPLCRKRVSSWARLHGRNKTLVNAELWRRVQEAFPMACQQRLNGHDADNAGVSLLPGFNTKPTLSQPGELRREYEDQISRFAEEKRALEEAERVASEEYIQRLLAEEEERVAEERMRHEEKQLEDDERLARLLSHELNKSPVCSVQKSVRPNEKVKKGGAGDIGRFLLPLPHRSSCGSASSFTANKENLPSHQPKTSLQRWVDTEKSAEPEAALLVHGEEERLTPLTLLSQTEQDRGSTHPPGLHCSGTQACHSTQTAAQFSVQRVSSDTEFEGLSDTDSTRPCPTTTPLWRELAQLEEELCSRKQQEAEDRQLALRLQRQLDREEALRAVDRSKGSADQYELRGKSSTTPGNPNSPSPGHCAPSSSRKRSSSGLAQKDVKDKVRRRVSACSSSESQKRVHVSSRAERHKTCKQTTLTKMFSSLNS